MNFIMITLEINMVTNQNYCLLILNKIKTEDVHENVIKDKEMFDFSNYSAKSQYYDNLNALVVRKMKDETGGLTIIEFVLKSKMYSFLVDDTG